MEAKTKDQKSGADTKKMVGSDQMWKCQECGQLFSTFAAKKKHEKFNHLLLKPYNCECGQQFGKLSEINYHIRRIHNKEKNFICEICSKAFFKNSDLVSHSSTHETSGKFMCKDCGRRFKHVSNLIRHSRIHTGVKPYPCFVCNKRFSQIAALRQHELTEEHRNKAATTKTKADDQKTDKSAPEHTLIEAKTEENEKQNKLKEHKNRKWWFYCKVCGERFQFSVLLRDHEIKHVLNNEVNCNSCTKNFGSVAELNNHACISSSKDESVVIRSESNLKPLDNKILREKEAEGKTKTVAEEIEKDKKIELTLSQNGQIMLDNDEVLLTLNDKVYGLLLINNDVTILENDEYLQVLNNNKDLFDEAELNKNSEMENEFNMDCHQVLGKDIENSDMENWLLKNQIYSNEITSDNQISNLDFEKTETKEEKTTVKKKKISNTFSCSECGKVFNKKGNYQQHLGIHFVKMQKHKCPECNRDFAWKSTLRKHIVKVHSFEKTQFSCEQCGKTYRSNILVQHHIKRDHLNIRSHKCSFCGKCFFRGYDLKVHTRIHTNERSYICGVCGKRFRHLSHSIRHDKTHQKKNDELVGKKLESK